MKISISLSGVFILYALCLLGVITDPSVVHWITKLSYVILGIGLLLQFFGVAMLILIANKAVPPQNVKRIPPAPNLIKWCVGTVSTIALIVCFTVYKEYLLAGLLGLSLGLNLWTFLLNRKIHTKLFL